MAVDIAVCVALPIFAWFAAFITMAQFAKEGGDFWWAPLFPHRNFEGFWRVFYLHLCFAGVVQSVTVPEHVRSLPWGYIGIVGFVLGFLIFACLSQWQLNDETKEQMPTEIRRTVRQFGVLIGVVYVGLFAFVVCCGLTRPK